MFESFFSREQQISSQQGPHFEIPKKRSEFQKGPASGESSTGLREFAKEKKTSVAPENLNNHETLETPGYSDTLEGIAERTEFNLLEIQARSEELDSINAKNIDVSDLKKMLSEAKNDFLFEQHICTLYTLNYLTPGRSVEDAVNMLSGFEDQSRADTPYQVYRSFVQSLPQSAYDNTEEAILEIADAYRTFRKNALKNEPPKPTKWKERLSKLLHQENPNELIAFMDKYYAPYLNMEEDLRKNNLIYRLKPAEKELSGEEKKKLAQFI